MTTISLGFSPCPNDTFIFDALLHGKIDTEGLTFEAVLGDVEWLNQKAFNGELTMTKLSYHAYAYLLQDYALLNSGSALGNNCGPLLIAREDFDLADLSKKSIAIPGQYTTANFLLSVAHPQATKKNEVLFSDIEDQVLNGTVDAGLIIHENRFTYQERGLIQLVDLGEWWETTTRLPIPLGGIVVQRHLPLELQQCIDRVLRRSIEHAFAHPEEAMPYIRQHAQAMEDHVMQQHIDLYVNHFSIDLGERGRAAVVHLFDRAIQLELIQPIDLPIFVPKGT